ncbi:MAG: class I poly(R)-hydroxyalkanoic acid synthase, partial [Alphaproteobacteria bacterium]
YQENLLPVPGGIELGGVGIDLTKIELPVFILSTREDHIAPWKSTFAATRLYKGPVRFCLSASGHIAGVVNPPAAQKYSYWTSAKKAATPDEWLAGADQRPGSWWPEWAKWVAKHGGGKVKARVPGGGALKPIEDAPGSYVRVTAGS